jgi:hypothetical protein
LVNKTPIRTARKTEPNEMNEPTANKFWLVWKIHGAPSTAQHQTAEIAKAEASRLAEKHPGERFVVLQAMSVFIATVNPPQELRCIKCEAYF